LSELASLAEQYVDAHANNKKEWPKNQRLKVTCLPQVRGRLRGVAEVIGMENQKQEEIALIAARLVIWLDTVR